MKPFVASRNSSSMVSMRFFVSGPVSSHFCSPGPNGHRRLACRSRRRRTLLTPRGPNWALNAGFFRKVRILRKVMMFQKAAQPRGCRLLPVPHRQGHEVPSFCKEPQQTYLLESRFCKRKTGSFRVWPPRQVEGFSSTVIGDLSGRPLSGDVGR